MTFNIKKKGDLDIVPFIFHTNNHDILLLEERGFGHSSFSFSCQ